MQEERQEDLWMKPSKQANELLQLNGILLVCDKHQTIFERRDVKLILHESKSPTRQFTSTTGSRLSEAWAPFITHRLLEHNVCSFIVKGNAILLVCYFHWLPFLYHKKEAGVEMKACNNAKELQCCPFQTLAALFPISLNSTVKVSQPRSTTVFL